jgi:hypothetical protein
LFASFGGSALNDLVTLTVGTEHGNEHHDILFVKMSLANPVEAMQGAPLFQ